MDYVSNVANSISSYSDCLSVLGPEVYTMIAEWEKKEIPLDLVIKSVEDVCRCGDESSGMPASIESLHNAVITNFRNWLLLDNSQITAAA